MLGTRNFQYIARRAFSLKKTLVTSEHVAAGGKLVDFAGYGMPVQYEGKDNPQALSIIESCLWTRQNCSMFDVSHMCSIFWKGKDAARFLERVTVLDALDLPKNRGSLSMITTESGGILDDTMITNIDVDGEKYQYMVVNAGNGDVDIAHFKRELAKFDGDVKMEVNWDNRGLFAVQGPKAADVVERLSKTSVKDMSFLETRFLTIEGHKCIVSRCGYTGEDGFEVYVPEEGALKVWRSLQAQPEVRLAGLGARDSLRLEAGLCLHGHDISTETTPVEGNLSWTIGKRRRVEGGFIGDKVILPQLKDKTHTRLRVGLKALSKGPVARENAEILVDGKVVGKVTSGSQSPVLRENIAMGYINKPHQKIGTQVEVQVRNKKIPAVVSKMPFVPTSYYKP